MKVAYIVALLNPPGCVCPLTEASFTWNIRMSSYLDFWQGTPPIDCKCFVMCGRSLGRKVCLSSHVRYLRILVNVRYAGAMPFALALGSHNFPNSFINS